MRYNKDVVFAWRGGEEGGVCDILHRIGGNFMALYKYGLLLTL